MKSRIIFSDDGMMIRVVGGIGGGGGGGESPISDNNNELSEKILTVLVLPFDQSIFFKDI